MSQYLQLGIDVLKALGLFNPLVHFVAFCFLLAYVTWFFFLAIMSLVAARDAGKLSTVTLYLGYPMGLLGVVLDMLVNVVVGTIIFLELPKEWLLTLRCDRLMTTGNPWRANLASWLCKNLLDPFQTGGHCHKIGGPAA